MTDVLISLTSDLRSGIELAPDKVAAAAAALTSDLAPDETKAEFLSALSRKGETAAEIAAFASFFRELAINPELGEWSARAVDIVGTGGDHSGGFNISTMVTLVVSCAGVPVMKHGNRGITSKCGSADLFAAMGVPLDAKPAMQKAAMAELGYVFFFAPCCHPSFRLIAAVRKALAARGERTVFNILGPLLNPGRPAHVVLGAATPAMADKLADALQVLEIPAGLVVHGIIAPGRGIDELTTATVNLVRGAGRLRHVREEWTPQALGFTQSAFESVAGGDVETNLAIARALAGGGGPGGLADTIALNSAVALWVAGARPDVGGSIAEARELLLGGAVREKMERTLEFYSR